MSLAEAILEGSFQGQDVASHLQPQKGKRMVFTTGCAAPISILTPGGAAREHAACQWRRRDKIFVNRRQCGCMSESIKVGALGRWNRDRLTRLTCELCRRKILADGIHTLDDGVEALVLHATKEHGRHFSVCVSNSVVADSVGEIRLWIEARTTSMA